MIASMRAGIVLFSMAILVTVPVTAQKVWSLQACIETAKEQNIQVQRQKILIDAAKSRLNTSRAQALPTVDGWATHNYSSGKTVNYEDYTYINTQYQDGNLGVQASLPLFQGLSGWHQIRQDKFALMSAEEQTEALERDITIQVTTAYLQVLLCEELLRVAQEKLGSSHQQTYRAEEYYAVGRVAKSEVLSMKSQESSDALLVTEAQGNLDLANLVLRQLMNLEGEQPIEIEKPTENEQPVIIPPTGSVFEYARAHQPRIASLEHQLLSAESGLKSMWGTASPSVSLDGFVYSRYSELGVNQLDPGAPYPYQDQLKDNSYGRISLNVRIPIFHNLNTRDRINQARIQVLDARLALEAGNRTLREEIQRARMEAQTADARLESSKHAVTSAQESYDMVEEQFNAGVVTSVDLKIAGAQLVEAKANLLQARYALMLRAAILDFYLDRPILL